MKKNKETEDEVEKRKRSLKQVIQDIVKPSHMVVDFGNSSIKVAYGNFKNKNIEIFAHNIIPVGRDLVDDGKVLNPLEVATLLRESVDKNNIKVAGLTLILSGSEIIIREIQIPKVEEKEVGKIVEFEAQQYFPIELTQYMTDYKILDEIRVEDEDKLRILLVAVPLEQIRDYVKVAEYLGVRIKAIDLLINTTLKYFLGNNYLKEFRNDDGVSLDLSLDSIFSMDLQTMGRVAKKLMSNIKRSFKDNDADDEEASEEQEPNKFDKVMDKIKEVSKKVMSKISKNKGKKEKVGIEQEKGAIYALLDMGARTTSIYIYSDYRLRFNRTLLTGGDELDREIQKTIIMSEDDAREQKISRGSLIINENESQLYEDAEDFNKALTQSFNKILNDVSRFLEFYNSRSSEGNIQKIFIYGGASKLRGVREYMTNFFNVPVEYLEQGHYKVLYTGSNLEDYEQNKRSLINVVGGFVK